MSRLVLSYLPPDPRQHEGESRLMAGRGDGSRIPRGAARRARALGVDPQRRHRQLPVRGAEHVERGSARRQRAGGAVGGGVHRHAGRRSRTAGRDPAHRSFLRPVHGVRRARRRRAAPRGGAREGPMSALVRVYVWEVPVRVTHWLIVLSIAVLSVTGFYIGYPFVTVSGPAGRHFVMGWTKVIH